MEHQHTTAADNAEQQQAAAACSACAAGPKSGSPLEVRRGSPEVARTAAARTSYVVDPIHQQCKSPVIHAARKMSDPGGKIKPPNSIKAVKKKNLMPEASKKGASKKDANELVEVTLPSQELEEQDVEHALGLHQDVILPVIMEEIHDNVEIHDNADTNIGSNTPALKSNMSTSGTGTPMTEHARDLHQVQDIRTEDGDTMAVISDLLPATQSTVVDLEDELGEYVHNPSNDRMSNDIEEASLQVDSLNEVMVTRDS